MRTILSEVTTNVSRTCNKISKLTQIELISRKIMVLDFPSLLCTRILDNETKVIAMGMS